MESDGPDSSSRRRASSRRRPAPPGAEGRRLSAGASVGESRFSVSVVDGHGRPARAPGLGRWLAATMPATVRGEVTVALVSDVHMRRLNRAYRGGDYATDVLSFPAGEAAPAHSAASYLGDIVIATGVAARQARERGHALSTELCVLALHGVLHLLGYDHERDAGAMAAIERRLRRKGGLGTGLIEREVGR